MKVLLIYPTFEKVATKPSLGLMYLASVLRNEGHQVRIIEGTYRDVGNKFWKLRHDFPDFIGITCMTSMYHEIIKMRDFLHRWDVPLIFGGPHATVLPESLLAKGFNDFIVVGEGEKTILKIVNGETPHGIIQGEITENLDSLPFPARDLVDSKYFHRSTSIMASRGCPFNCSYCQPALRKLFGNKVRRRSASNVVEEMKACKEQFGTNLFEFFDDTFTSDREWVYDFCNEVEKHHFGWEILTRVDILDYNLLARMKEAGLTLVRLGIESGSQKILNSYSKGTTVEQSREALASCEELGIKVHGFFMLGALDETHESIQATKDFIDDNEFETIFVAITTPMPGTRLYEQALKEGRLNSSWMNFDLLGNLCTTVAPKNYKNVMDLKYLTGKEVLDAKYDILRRFYFRKICNPFYLLNFIRKNSLRYTWNAIKNVLEWT